jgi:hypothetical protein
MESRLSTTRQLIGVRCKMYRHTTAFQHAGKSTASAKFNAQALPSPQKPHQRFRVGFLKLTQGCEKSVVSMRPLPSIADVHFEQWIAS